ncbi:MAG: tripartite tricarboxylate transporter substrate-binding protein [Hydrogenophaga sp.]
MNIRFTLRSTARRTLLAASAALALLGATTAPAQAQDKPVIRILVGFPSGAGTDVLARIYGEALAEAIGATIVVDNKPGAGGLISNQLLKAATPDSNSLLVAIDHQIVMVPIITKNPGVDIKKDMKTVARLVNIYTCLAVPANSPASTMAEYVAAVKKDPAQGNYGVPAPGSQAQFVGYVYGQHYGIEVNAVPYRGAAPAITDLLGGQIPSAIVPCDALVEHRKAGKIRVLAVAADTRRPQMPDVPTFAELGVKMPADGFLGVYAAANFNPTLLKRIEDATSRMLDNPAVSRKIAAANMEASYADGKQLEALVDKSQAFWAEQVRKTNFQLQ